MRDKGHKILEGLSEKEIKDIYRELISYAEYKLNFVSHQGIDAEDFVSKVLRKVLDINSEDHRKWNPEKNPDILKFFKGCISSEISNHFNLKSSESLVDVNHETERDFFESLEGNSDIFEELIANELRDILIDELIEYDESLAELLLFQEKEFTAAEIADELNYDSVEDVYNARKRLRRACESFIAKIKS
jgi:hypothetical protein